MKKNVKRTAKKAYKRIRTSKYFGSLIAIVVIAFVIYVLIPPHEENNAYSPISIDKLEIPLSPYDEQVVEHKAYTLGYNEDAEQANWVAYALTRDNLLNPIVERSNDFKEDPFVVTGSATLSDYRKSNYDRGHLAPAADFRWDKDAMNESFYMSNMSPQAPDFNRGIWSTLESVVRNNAYNNGKMYITTGPVFYTDDTQKTIGANKVKVPDAFYKALLVYSDSDKKTIGFLLPNEKGTRPLSSYTISIDNLEKLTGLDFFYNLPDDIENEIENSYDLSAWDFSEFRSPSVTTNSEPQKKNTSDHSFTRTLYLLRTVKSQIRTAIGLD